MRNKGNTGKEINEMENKHTAEMTAETKSLPLKSKINFWWNWKEKDDSRQS